MHDSRIPRIKNAEFSGYYFYMNKSISKDLQICISEPLNIFFMANLIFPLLLFMFKFVNILGTNMVSWYTLINTQLFLTPNVRSSRPEVFCGKGDLKIFAKFTGKHLRQSLFFNKVARDSGTVVFL